MTSSRQAGPISAPAACTLPPAEQPVRIAQFDALFANHVRDVRRETPGRVVFELTAGAETAAAAAGLAAKETGCCSFFAFELTIAAGATTLTVSVTDGHHDVVAALADRAETLAGTAA